MSENTVNLNSAINTGNTGKITSFPTLGTIRASILAPVNTIIPAANLASPAAFATYMNANFMEASRGGANPRWFAFNALDDFKDESKKTSSEDTGRLQLDIYNFPPKFSFRYMQGMGNYIEMTQFNNCQGLYDFFFLDDFGNIWGTLDQTGANGLKAYTNQQFYVIPHMAKTTKTDSAYTFSISLADVTQFNQNFKVYQANYPPDAIIMPENAVLTDISAAAHTLLGTTSTTDLVATIQVGQNSWDFVQEYGASLTVGCFAATDLNVNTVLTVASIQGYGFAAAIGWYVWLRLSAAPTATHQVQLTFVSPTALNVIIPGANVVVEVPYPLVNGQNAAVHTF